MYLQSTRLCGLRPQSYINVWLVCTDFVCRISSPVKDLPYRVYNWRYNNDLHCIVSILGRQVALKISADALMLYVSLWSALNILYHFFAVVSTRIINSACPVRSDREAHRLLCFPSFRLFRCRIQALMDFSTQTGPRCLR